MPESELSKEYQWRGWTELCRSDGRYETIRKRWGLQAIEEADPAEWEVSPARINFDRKIIKLYKKYILKDRSGDTEYDYMRQYIKAHDEAEKSE